VWHRAASQSDALTVDENQRQRYEFLKLAAWSADTLSQADLTRFVREVLGIQDYERDEATGFATSEYLPLCVARRRLCNE